jgi:hypothetical protein
MVLYRHQNIRVIGTVENEYLQVLQTDALRLGRMSRVDFTEMSKRAKVSSVTATRATTGSTLLIIYSLPMPCFYDPSLQSKEEHDIIIIILSPPCIDRYTMFQ